METTFKKGDRVRLKAWITKTKLGGLDRLFPQGCVGIVTRTQGCVQGIPYLDLRAPTLKRAYHRVCVAIEDLELMPERQVHVVKDGKVHVVKDGKVYEMRKSEPTKLPCIKCSLSEFGKTCPTPCPGYYNYQEVKSGKLVS